MLVSAQRLLSRAVCTAAAGLTLACASTSYAQSNFTVNVITQPLVGSVSAPFSIDFQFNDGGILGNNSVTISNFSYSGGGASGAATLLGGALGDVASIVTFDNSNAFQELFQSFTPGTTLSFDVLLTNNSDVIAPDAFVFAILDSNLANIPTTGLGDSLLLVSLDASLSSVQTFAGTGAFAGVTVTTAPVPEPEIVAMMLAGMGLLGFVARRRRSA